MRFDGIEAFSGDDVGYAVAEALGLDAWFHMSGDDGTAHHLEEGGILKTTGNDKEAAIFAALKSAQDLGLSHPAVPSVERVARFVQDVDLSDYDFVGRTRDEMRHVPLRKFAVVREDFRDVDPELEGWTDDRRGNWSRKLAEFGWHWTHGEPGGVERFLDEHGPEWPEIVQIHEGLVHVLRVTGFKVHDVRPSNVGRGPSGAVGMRDMGRATGPDPDEAVLSTLPVVEPSAPEFRGP